MSPSRAFATLRTGIACVLIASLSGCCLFMPCGNFGGSHGGGGHGGDRGGPGGGGYDGPRR